MRQSAKISASEWEIMNAVWDCHPITASEVLARLPEGAERSQKTVNTFLARLVEKGALQAEKRSNLNFYTPLAPREACIASEGETFLRRVFRGATGALLAHFCERGDLSDAELAELEKMIAKARSDRRKRP